MKQVSCGFALEAVFGCDVGTRLLYCHCAYAQVIPKGVKHDVLRALTDSGVDFDAVADLCEMSAK